MTLSGLPHVLNCKFSLLNISTTNSKPDSMTTIAVMQCVERGQLSLDDDVTKVLPELTGREIIKGFEEDSGKSILVPNSKPITLRFENS